MTGAILLKLFIYFTVGVALVVLLGHLLLPVLVRLKVGQTIRAEGPQRHLSKSGTPTMGGIIFVLAMLILFALHCGKEATHWLWLFSFLAFGLIGFLDDIYKVVLHRNLGLRGYQKLIGQFLAVALLLLGNELLLGRGTTLYLPSALFGGSMQPWLDLGWFYYPLVAIFFVGMVNAVNLTDGLDGLVSGVSIPVFIGFALTIAALVGSFSLTENISLYAVGLAGCCLGFLYFNHYPARVFMGDTGSMALGGALVGFTLVARMEIVLLGFGLVYLIEAVSVMLQVASFQLTGKRIFLMTPLHHHFELKGWRETKVTALFCLASTCFVVITLVLCVI